MRAENSRGGPLVTDRPTAENHPGESKFASEDTGAVGQNATRRTDLVNVWAHIYLAVGTRGRCRSVIIVPSCFYCGRPHVHSGKPDFTVGKRQASCHEGRYIVHAGTVEGEVAA